MDNMSPIPKPRPSPPVPVRNPVVKKPIPLPRFKNLIRRESIDKTTTQHEYSNAESREGSPKQSMSQMLRDEIKSASDNVQVRGKSVMESTRRLARNMIPKRFTTQQEYNGKENPLLSGAIPNRSQSLPSDDIFQSISFDSPLSQTPEGSEIMDSCVSFSDMDSCLESPIENHPPPHYPPPPLPDETLYDEVLSVKSSHSGSQQDSYHCSSETDLYRDIDCIYEELSNTRSLDVCSDDMGGPQLSHMDSASLPLPAKTVSRFSRSDSWTYYDTVNCPHTEEGGKGIASNIYNEDPVALAAKKLPENSSPSISSELEALSVSVEGAVSNHCNQSSPTPSSSVSLSSASGLSSSFSNGVELRKKGALFSQKTPSKSVILEFDPLYENVPSAESLADSGLSQNDLMILAGLAPAKAVKTSNYGKVIVKSTESDNNNHENSSPSKMTTIEESEASRPPTPPKRFDSISEASADIDKQESNASHYDTCSVSSQKSSVPDTSADGDLTSGRFSLIRHHWPSMKRVMKLAYPRDSRVLPSESIIASEKGPGSSFYTNNPSITSKLERPHLEPVLAVQYNGHVYRTTSGSRDMHLRWCHLAEGHLVCTADKSGSGSKEVISLDTVSSVQIVLEHPTGLDGEELYCFEVSSTGKSRNQWFGVTASMERRVWMQKILENFTTVFPSLVSSGYTRFGWCYLKEGIGGNWMAAWLLLYKRTLYYCVPKGVLCEADLRKARSIVIQEPHSVSPLILIDFPKLSLYLRTERTNETSAWRNSIKSAATDNGPELGSQQLTQDNVPVLVEKCINFVYAHGSLSEGIYRRNGANSNVARLLAMFRQDAWSVQLSRQEFSEYDVASVLKRFFRELPEPLLTAALHSLLCEASALEDDNKRFDAYRKHLENLPLVNSVTLRCLLAHLHFIHEESQHNLMPVANLAAIWGPTLMHIESKDEVTWSRQESKVVVDLVSLYPRLYDVDGEELVRVRRIREVLQRLHTGRVHPQQAKPSGDLRVWVHIGSKDSGECTNVTIGPQKTCSEVCSELASLLNLLPHQVTLREVVLGGALQRHLHFSERVFDTVLRWGYWDEEYRSQNFLVLVPNALFQELQTVIAPPITLSNELRFADEKTKSFKSFLFEFSQAKLFCYKDKRGSVKLAEWPVEDIVWYQGFEPRRNPNSRWALTFINKSDKPKRSKERPYFGCTLAGTCKEDHNKWMAALLAGEYPQGLLPPPIQLNLLE